MIVDYDRLSLSDPGFERFEGPMKQDPLCAAYLEHRSIQDLTTSLFAAATRSGGFHVPHYHENSVFTVCYYAVIPDVGTERTGLAFGADDMVIKHMVVPKLYDVWIWPSYFVLWTSRQMLDDLRINVGIDYRPPADAGPSAAGESGKVPGC